MTARLALVLLAGCASAPPAPKPTPASAPIETGWISGGVYLRDIAQIDSNAPDVPLANVVVIARAVSNGKRVSARSDGEGHVRIDVVPGEYQVAFVYERDVVRHDHIVVNASRPTFVSAKFTTNSWHHPGPRLTAR